MARNRNDPSQLPLFVPESDWQPITELPDLRGKVRELAFDTETRDISLSNGRGPGWVYNMGHVCGLSVAWQGGSFYAPINHPDSFCFEKEQIKRWIIDHDKAGIRFIAHNFPYDMGWLHSDLQVPIIKIFDDTVAMTVMVDENRLSYALDNVAKWLGFEGKDERLLAEAAASYGFGSDIKSNLWRLPARFVGPYAEADAIQTLNVARVLRKKIEEEDTKEAYQLEMDLIPMVLEMRRKGIKIDLELAERSRKNLISRRDAALRDLSDSLSHTVGMQEINSARHIEKWFTNLKIPFNRTPKSGQGQFESEWMEKHQHWLPRKISEIRQLELAQSKFLQGFLLDYSHKGRIHASINQFRGEEGGTRSHRFSYSDPPLQQMYSRGSTELKEELVSVIRGCFLPEDGEYWAAVDYSQQEFRLMVHFAELLKCNRSSFAGDMYRNNPSTDFHNLAAQMTKLPRSRAKDVNFAKAFGAGIKKFALMTEMSFDEAKTVMEQYDAELPFVKEAAQRCQRVAEQRGFIRLIDGARSHFEMWEPAYRNWDEEQVYRGEEGVTPCSLEEAEKRINNPKHPWKGRLVRAFAHKAWNRLIQGSAARQTKRAMKLCWDEKLIPLLQMHDELDFSLQNEKDGILIGELMRSAIKLTVPMKTDIEYGISWGSARKIENSKKEILYRASWDEAVRLKTEGKWW